MGIFKWLNKVPDEVQAELDSKTKLIQLQNEAIEGLNASNDSLILKLQEAKQREQKMAGESIELQNDLYASELEKERLEDEISSLVAELEGTQQELYVCKDSLSTEKILNDW